ncbi:MAG: acyl-CoA-binding protein [Muricauda sp.]|uniref:Valyl-tRNA synthetase n=1 Tax=Flagellimonas lutaonensis TaxID=516051 RepID=A0A0D5YV62_9FLAO|nr:MULTISPECIES: acyl-CoA-binding protein [Allomuricauda]AKA35791.1 valyl-tRNA synthetase [Allomuricauda lutaonensis]MAU26193.1 acyl-CoA-binding protein [Allomuricauda sp.]MBC31584.1 acyl-CoA-binding protein [Allomuricauda sp.]|tara:strand:+ start:93 stop:359 length:267 start_codon:yes stop_codon:yes gene_type:complete
MISEKLQKKFEKAVDFVNSYTEPLPADILLKLYAYYKIANKNFDNPGSKTPLINAFKANALIQARNISREEAMKQYIKIVDKEIKKSK